MPDRTAVIDLPSGDLQAMRDTPSATRAFLTIERDDSVSGPTWRQVAYGVLL